MTTESLQKLILSEMTPPFSQLGTATGTNGYFLHFKSFAPIGGNLFVPLLLPQWLIVSSWCCRPPIDPQLGTRQTTIQPCWKFRKNLPTHFPEGFLRAGNAQLDSASKTGLSSYLSFVIVFNPEHNTTLVGRHFWPLVIAFDDKKFRLHIWEFGRPMARRCRLWISSLQSLTCQVFRTNHFSLILFWKDLPFQRLGKREWRTNISRSKMRCLCRTMRRWATKSFEGTHASILLRSWMRQMQMMVTQSWAWWRVSPASPMEQHLLPPRQRPGLGRPARLSRWTKLMIFFIDAWQ